MAKNFLCWSLSPAEDWNLFHIFILMCWHSLNASLFWLIIPQHYWSKRTGFGRCCNDLIDIEDRVWSMSLRFLSASTQLPVGSQECKVHTWWQNKSMWQPWYNCLVHRALLVCILKATVGAFEAKECVSWTMASNIINWRVQPKHVIGKFDTLRMCMHTTSQWLASILRAFKERFCIVWAGKV